MTLPSRASRVLGAFALSWAVLAFAGTGCTPSEQFSGTYQGKYPIKVLCTTGMVADLVKNVGGDHVEVTQLMGAGVDPHLYKASPGDVNAMQQADAVFYSGRNLEGKMGELFGRMGRLKPTVAVTNALDDSEVFKDDHGHYDPHLWFDVSLWSKGADVVRDALSQYDPPHADDYKKNAETYRAELAKLHEWAKTELAQIPKERRVLVTAHDAFRYFGRAYDIEVEGIQGISTESEAAVKRINDLVDLITRRQIKAIFVETSVAERNVQSLVEGCKSRGHEVRIGGELYSDAMGQPGTEEGTYPGMIRHNVNTIVKALK